MILTADPTVGAWRWMYADGDRTGGDDRDRPPVRLRQRPLADEPRPSRTKPSTSCSGCSNAPRAIPNRCIWPSWSIPTRRCTVTTAAEGAGAISSTGKNRRATILASVPWFLQDLGTYGIGIFTPTILSGTLIGHDITDARNVAGIVARDLEGAKGAALVDTLLIAGIIAAVLLADKGGPHPPAGDRIHRLRRRARAGRPAIPHRGADAHAAAVRRLHALQLS